MSGTPTYQTWRNMITRCTDQRMKDFKYYGGRGIKVCKRWLDFKKFFEDMGEKPDSLTLERIKNNGNYEPKNCKWTTMKKQSRNKRAYINQLWFYGHGPNNEMIIDNNQSRVGREFNLSNAHISSCLLGKLKQHKNWTFQNILQEGI